MAIRAARLWRVGALALAAAVIAVAAASGAFSELSEPRRLAARIEAQGAGGWAGFVLAYALLQPVGVPGTVFVFAAPLIWPWPVAFVLSMVGTMAASVIGFSFARFIARDWVSRRVPDRFHRFDAAIERNGLRTVFLLRLVFWMPQALHFFLGVSRVSFRDHFWGSILGYAPTLLLVSLYGADAFEVLAGLDRRAWIVIACVATGAALAGVVVWRCRRRVSGA